MNRRVIVFRVALLPLVAACASTRSPAPPVPTPATPMVARVERTAAAITADDLRSRLFVFAADSMMGRKTGTLGGVKATDYLAAELRRVGVEPAGENGTFFQTLPLMNWTRDTAAVLRVNGQPLQWSDDYLQIPGLPEYHLPYGMGAEFSHVPAVFGGFLGDSMLPPEEAAGKFVVFGPPRSPSDVNAEMASLPQRYASAVGIAFAFLEFVQRDHIGFMTEDQLKLADDVTSAPVGLMITTAAAGRMLGTPLSGASVGRGTGFLDGVVRFVGAPPPAPARNVVGVVRGRDSLLSHEYVALGAHSDHLGVANRPVNHDSLRAFNTVVRPMGADSPDRAATAQEQRRIDAIRDSLRHRGFPRLDSIYNGADDDGSGSVTLLEVAEAFARAATKPRRSLLFVWHTGEEEGLFGSQYYTDHPTVPRDSIVAQINIDMVGRGDSADITGGGPRYIQVIGSRRLSTELGDLVEQVNTDGGYHLAFDYQFDAAGHPEQYYCRSDHYEYARFGIPIVFFSTGSHQDYHQVTDEPDYIDYPKMARIGNYLHDLAARLANLDHRLVVDKPKPDPNAPCKQ